ncbi:glycoside hydrolase [Lacinutrix sp. WUR7]|uniref:isoamylase early set domain-containing protein n=1 Tax=Lacinutrix sp. WUR7 TaxID=2653681 RepID=UPI00193E6809|nr:isoamylase early set domain-containing protein [Lacinutrix sp. WUR7]QRM89155.1 glycoside hydrolase [Lacinutrix sp. WUR7]
MAIKKQFLKSKPVCKVTFTVPAKEAKEVLVVGNWNNWDAKAEPLQKLKNGTFKGTVNLESGNSYEFKYVVDGQWQNEEQADAFVWNEFAASDNSVINL